MTTPELDSRYSWTRLAITLLIAVIGNVGMWSIIVILPDVQAEFGSTRADASLPYVATMIGFALGNLWVGRAVDRFGMTRALVACAVVLTLAYAAAAYAPSLWALTVIQLIIGLGTASCFGPLIADISQWFLRRRGIAVAIAASGNYLSGAFWPVFLGWLAGEGDWRAVYLWLALFTALLMIPLPFLLRRRVSADTLATSETAARARSRSVGLSPRALQWLLGLAGVGCCVAMSMPQVHIVALCVDLGFGAAVGAEMLSLMLMGGVVSRIISGLMADRLGGVATLLIGSTLQAIALFLYLPAGGLVSLYVVSLIFGLSQGGIVPSYAVIVREYMPAREAGARVGFVIMLTVFGMALGGWLSGAIYDWTGSYHWAFINGIAWNGLNIAVMIYLLTRGRKLPQGAVAA